MSLKVAKHVWTTLKNDEGVSAITSGRVWPLVAEQGTNGKPYVTFEVSTGPTEYTKDGPVCDTHTVILKCVALKYEVAADLAEAVRGALELNRTEYPEDGYEVTECELEGADDDWTDGVGYEVVVTMSVETEFI